MPKTLTSLELNYYDYYTNFNISQHVDLDPDIPLQVGDAITFTVNIEDLLDGAGSGVFNWEDISWNDLGEITVP